MTQNTFSKVSEYIKQNEQRYIEKLRDAVAIPSVSGDINRRADVFKMGKWLADEMQRLNITIKQHLPGKHMMDGVEAELPPIIMGSYGSDEKKKTVLVYGHYDVQPALLSDGWNTDPWTLVEKEGKLYGRGSTDDKAPVISWLWVIEAHQKLGLDMPVNVLMCFEGMEESGSEGLDDLIHSESTKFFKTADCVCISDNYWLGTTKPCLTYGLRGVSYFQISIKGPGKDLHSGLFGGAVHEPMTDLVLLLSKLVTPEGKILVPSIYDDVAPVTEAEEKMYETLDFSFKDVHNATESTNTIHKSEKELLMARWRYPSLSLHGIEGAFYSSGAKTVIPAKVIGKFSIRSVPNQDPARLTQIVTDYVNSEFKKLNSKNVIGIECLHEGKAWLADVNDWNFRSAATAIEKVFGVKPDMTREGGSIPVTLTFQEALQKSVLLLPMGRSDDGAHSTNEKIDRFNYIEGIKLLCCYLNEIAASS
ncbi:hypothetical protein HDU92_000248 [Lobulomyces angularis]|nr:hypothetical protein HDU92_000248 [Lobulomyces angularis]